MKKFALVLALAMVPTFGQTAIASSQTDSKIQEKKVETVIDTAVFEVLSKDEKSVSLVMLGGLGYHGTGFLEKGSHELSIDKFANKNVEIGDKFIISEKIQENSKDHLLKNPSDIKKVDFSQNYISGVEDGKNNRKNTLVVDGITYVDRGFYSAYTDINEDDYNYLEGINLLRGMYIPYVRLSDPKTIAVPDPILTKIYVAEDYPKDKIPAEVYNAKYNVKSVDEKTDEVRLELLGASDDKFYNYPKDLTYGGKLPNYKKASLKAGDEIKLWGNVARDGGGDYLYIEILKYEKIENISADKSLALAVFDSIVTNRSAEMLLEINPKASKPIEKKLKSLISESQVLIDEAYKYFSQKTDLTKEEENQATLQILRHYYDKKIETKAEEELALSLFDSIITTDAAKTLIKTNPKAAEKSKDKLEKQIAESGALVEEALRALK